MKALSILAVVCVVGAIPAYAAYDTNYLECSQKFDINFDVLEQLAEDESYQPPEELYCYFACVRDKQFEEKGIKKSIYEELMGLIRQADEKYGIDNDLYNRKDLEKILTECKSKGLNDCDYLKCIRFFNEPISTFLKHFA